MGELTHFAARRTSYTIGLLMHGEGSGEDDCGMVLTQHHEPSKPMAK
jgi:hypothetical protein